MLAAALRFLNLGYDSLWFDEVLTRQTAAAGLAAALAVRDHVPLLYWLTTVALRLLPEHEVTLRLVSALAGVLAVPGLVALGRVVGRPRAGLWAALLLAVSPFAIRYLAGGAPLLVAAALRPAGDGAAAAGAGGGAAGATGWPMAWPPRWPC